MIQGSSEHWTLGGTRDTIKSASALQKKLNGQGYKTFMRKVRKSKAWTAESFKQTTFANN